MSLGMKLWAYQFTAELHVYVLPEFVRPASDFPFLRNKLPNSVNISQSSFS